MKVPFLKGQAFPRFLVFGEEATIHSLRGLFKRSGLIGKHHFVVANEASAADGHAGPFISLKGFTHVVYDCRAFSFLQLSACCPAIGKWDCVWNL